MTASIAAKFALRTAFPEHLSDFDVDGIVNRLFERGYSLVKSAYLEGSPEALSLKLKEAYCNSDAWQKTSIELGDDKLKLMGMLGEWKCRALEAERALASVTASLERLEAIAMKREEESG